MLETVIIEPKQAAQAAIIWLHGFGADGHNFAQIVPELQLHLTDTLNVRFIFPHAPKRPVTAYPGMKIRAWYDICLDNFLVNQDVAGIQQSAVAIEQLIQAQLHAGISANKIVLAGFSQGGAMALHVGLRLHQPLAGILALSTYLPMHETLTLERNASNQHTPIMMVHGIDDPVVPFALGERSKQWLENLNYHISWHTYQMLHQICTEEIAQIGIWLRTVVV